RDSRRSGGAGRCQGQPRRRNEAARPAQSGGERGLRGQRPSASGSRRQQQGGNVRRAQRQSRSIRRAQQQSGNIRCAQRQRDSIRGRRRDSAQGQKSRQGSQGGGIAEPRFRSSCAGLTRASIKKMSPSSVKNSQAIERTG